MTVESALAKELVDDGVAEDIKQRAQFTWSLSELVFPHMLVRLILAEQVYRACSILANEKYHHE
jgi:23S rRNA (pseudouridine1915-N3)-methyltransferase